MLYEVITIRKSAPVSEVESLLDYDVTLIVEQAAGQRPSHRVRVTAPVIGSAPNLWNYDPWLLRPPGSVAEAEFLRRCIRCGECMKVS